MPEVLDAPKEAFVSGLDAVGQLDGPPWARAIREAGAARYGELELPHRKAEIWRFTNVAPILKSRFDSITATRDHGLGYEHVAPFLFNEPGWAELVFVDGFYAPDLSSVAGLTNGLTVEGLLEAIEAGRPGVEAHLDKYFSKDDVFAALNSAFLRDGAYVHLAKNVICENPVHLVFVNTGHEALRAVYPRNLVVADTLSELKIVESHVALDGANAYLSCPCTEIAVNDGAHVKYFKNIREARSAYHMGSVMVNQQRDSRFMSHVTALTGQIARNDLRVYFGGPGGECELFGLTMNDNDRVIDNPLRIDHAQPHCRSRITYRNILDGESSTVFTGKVYAHRDAQKTDSDQINNSLLLSEKATIDTKPQLEIYADDVKCTHGATIGAPPEEIIFYFRSRGIADTIAREILTFGFANDILNEIEIEPLRKQLAKLVADTRGRGRSEELVWPLPH